MMRFLDRLPSEDKTGNRFAGFGNDDLFALRALSSTSVYPY